MKNRVLVVIVTYNGMQWLAKCLRSLHESSFEHDVILIDNCSNDGTVDFVSENYSFIRLVKSSLNLGFGKANNIGLEYAVSNGYDHVLLLNQDVYVDKLMIEKLVNFSNLNPRYGIISPLQLTGDGKSFDKNFSVAISKSTTISFDSAITSDEVFELPFVMAAIWLINIETVKVVGGFNPLFSHYGEDNDYVNRVVYHNKKIAVYSAAKGLHDRHFRNVSSDKKLYIYGYVRYLYILTNINDSFLQSFFKFIYLFIVRSLLLCIKGEFGLIIKNFDYFKSILMNLRNILRSRNLTRSSSSTFLSL